jgi:hypothetical protein
MHPYLVIISFIAVAANEFEVKTIQLGLDAGI